MRVLFRADASARLGTGHVSRCLALGHALKVRGAQVTFACRTSAGDHIDAITAAGMGVLRMRGATDGVTHHDVYPWATDVEAVRTVIGDERYGCIVVDHYGLDARWEEAMRGTCGTLVAVDDLANRPHACDVLIDHNLGADADTMYRDLVPAATRLCLGQRFALLRAEFTQHRTALERHFAKVERVLVSYGGSDPHDETSKALDGLERLHTEKSIACTVVAGSANPRVEALRRRVARQRGWRFFHATTSMAELMLDADVALGGGGISNWERCCLGLPALVTQLAENQRASTQRLARTGAIVDVGPATATTPETYVTLLRGLDGERLAAMSQRGRALVDGLGAERIAQMLHASAGVHASA